MKGCVAISTNATERCSKTDILALPSMRSTTTLAVVMSLDAFLIKPRLNVSLNFLGATAGDGVVVAQHLVSFCSGTNKLDCTQRWYNIKSLLPISAVEN